MAIDVAKHILFIEDDEASRHPLTTALTAHGFTITQTPDGKQGLEKAFQEHPDLILLDLVLPEMSGVDFMESLRQDPWGAIVPVIILTSVSPDTKNTIETIDKYKPAFYLTKGELSLDETIQRIKQVLHLE